VGTLLLFAVVVVPPLLLIQRTPRARDWPWLLLVGAGVVALAASVPFVLNAWARRFPAAAERAGRLESSRRFWLVWLVGVLLVIAYGGPGRVADMLVPLGIAVAVAGWRVRGNHRDAQG
jgi:hypothetical protein